METEKTIHCLMKDKIDADLHKKMLPYIEAKQLIIINNYKKKYVGEKYVDRCNPAEHTILDVIAIPFSHPERVNFLTIMCQVGYDKACVEYEDKPRVNWVIECVISPCNSKIDFNSQRLDYVVYCLDSE